MKTNFEKRKESILADLDLIEQLVKMDYYQDAATKLRQVRTKCMDLGNDIQLVKAEEGKT